jgi:hypothetical protein
MLTTGLHEEALRSTAAMALALNSATQARSFISSTAIGFGPALIAPMAIGVLNVTPLGDLRHGWDFSAGRRVRESPISRK